MSPVEVQIAERMKGDKHEVWKPDGKGWREIPRRTLEREVEKLGLRK